MKGTLGQAVVAQIRREGVFSGFSDTVDEAALYVYRPDNLFVLMDAMLKRYELAQKVAAECS